MYIYTYVHVHICVYIYLYILHISNSVSHVSLLYHFANISKERWRVPLGEGHSLAQSLVNFFENPLQNRVLKEPYYACI